MQTTQAQALGKQRTQAQGQQQAQVAGCSCSTDTTVPGHPASTSPQTVAHNSVQATSSARACSQGQPSAAGSAPAIKLSSLEVFSTSALAKVRFGVGSLTMLLLSGVCWLRYCGAATYRDSLIEKASWLMYSIWSCGE